MTVLLLISRIHVYIHMGGGGGTEKQLQAIRSSDVNLNATITCEAWGWSAFEVQDPSSSYISARPTPLHPCLSS